jgi:hypothetical protein
MISSLFRQRDKSIVEKVSEGHSISQFLAGSPTVPNRMPIPECVSRSLWDCISRLVHRNVRKKVSTRNVWITSHINEVPETWLVGHYRVLTSFWIDSESTVKNSVANELDALYACNAIRYFCSIPYYNVLSEVLWYQQVRRTNFILIPAIASRVCTVQIRQNNERIKGKKEKIEFPQTGKIENLKIQGRSMQRRGKGTRELNLGTKIPHGEWTRQPNTEIKMVVYYSALQLH